MMALRRNARWLGLGGIVGAAVIGVWLAASRESTGAALLLQMYPTLDEVSADRIDELRRATGLDNDALAAVNGTNQQLETVLAASRTWFESNAADLAARQAAISDKRAEIRRLESANNNGSDVITELNAARADLGQLEADHTSYLASTRSGWLTSLSQAQRDLMGVMRGNTDLPMPYRVLDVDDAQKRQLSRARTRYHQRLSGTRDAASRRAMRQTYDQEVAAAIGASNLRQLDTLAGYLGAASQRVSAAVNYVLPRGFEG